MYGHVFGLQKVSGIGSLRLRDVGGGAASERVMWMSRGALELEMGSASPSMILRGLHGEGEWASGCSCGHGHEYEMAGVIGWSSLSRRTRFAICRLGLVRVLARLGERAWACF